MGKRWKGGGLGEVPRLRPRGDRGGKYLIAQLFGLANPAY